VFHISIFGGIEALFGGA